MTTDTNAPGYDHKGRKVIYRGASAPVYGLGLIGALVYYLQHATTFLAVLLGIFKAIIWPALLIYQVLGFLKM